MRNSPGGYFFSSGDGEASSFTPFLNSLIVRPKALPSSGSFRGPKIKSAIPRMRRSSGKPMFGNLHSLGKTAGSIAQALWPSRLRGVAEGQRAEYNLASFKRKPVPEV